MDSREVENKAEVSFPSESRLTSSVSSHPIIGKRFFAPKSEITNAPFSSLKSIDIASASPETFELIFTQPEERVEVALSNSVVARYGFKGSAAKEIKGAARLLTIKSLIWNGIDLLKICICLCLIMD